jgi:hypothetical protein
MGYVPSSGDDGAGQGTEVAHTHEDKELTEGTRHTKGGNLRQGSQLFIFFLFFTYQPTIVSSPNNREKHL